MICINNGFLRSVGVPEELIASITKHGAGNGLATSELFSFGGGGNGGRDSDALEKEAVPRNLVLVGMGDRYKVGAKLANVVTICVDADELNPRKPTPNERMVIVHELELSKHPDARALVDLLCR